MTEARRVRTNLPATLTNYLIVSVMVTCMAIAIVQFGQQLVPAWNAGYIPIWSFFVALEAAISTRWVRQARRPVPWYTVRAGEALILFFAARSLLGLMRGPEPAVEVSSFRGYADSELMALLFVTGLVWALSWRFMRSLTDLEMAEIPPTDRELFQAVDETQVNARQTLVKTILVVGVPMVLFNAVTRMSLRNAGEERLAAQTPFAHLLVFFVLGLVLLSRTRLTMLSVSWEWERIPVAQSVRGRWMGYSLALLAIISLLAVILPTRYSLGLLSTLGYLFNLLVAFTQTILLLLVAVLTALLGWLFPSMPQQPAPSLPQLPPFLRDNGTSAPPLSEFLQSLAFWIVFLMVMGYLVRQYVRSHPQIEEVLQQLPGWSLVRRLWQSLRSWFSGWRARITTAIEERRRARSAAAARSELAARRWLNLRHLSPRDQVQFYYQAVLRRGNERGLPRRPAQTPYEYAQQLEARLPEVDRDVASITHEFIEARYSRHDIAPHQVNLVRRYWERIKRALRRR
jgi:hypothetical protein